MLARGDTILRNARQQMSGHALLRGLPDACARLAFLDPQYRSILDKMAYGNEGKGRERRRATLPAMTDHDVALMVEQIERVLRPSGYAILWLDKFMIGTGHHLHYFRFVETMRVVDVGHWNKGRPGMGRRLRCKSEYYLVAQKAPHRAKGTWSDHRLEDAWIEQSDRTEHPHAKPHQLTERLIRATTKKGDLVVDPCAGGYVVLDACRASGREFVGCDLIG